MSEDHRHVLADVELARVRRADVELAGIGYSEVSPPVDRRVFMELTARVGKVPVWVDSAEVVGVEWLELDLGHPFSRLRLRSGAELNVLDVPDVVLALMGVVVVESPDRG